MGFQLKYFLVDAPLLPLCDLLGLEDLGIRAKGADVRGAVLPSGFCLIKDSVHSTLIHSGRCKRISMTYPVIYGHVHEGVSNSSAEKWENGEKIWQVEHDACIHGPRHLEYSGSLPDMFDEVKNKYFAEQDEEDKLEDDGCDVIFEIPVEIIDRLTGYRYCKNMPEEMFHSLVRRPL